MSPIILLMAWAAWPLSSAHAQMTTDRPEFVAAGRRLAIRNCGECHAVDVGMISPFDPAPPFPQLFKRFPVDRMDEILEKDLLADRAHMKPFELGPDERQEIIAFFRSLERRPDP